MVLMFFEKIRKFMEIRINFDMEEPRYKQDKR
jgi:hypothetical protein